MIHQTLITSFYKLVEKSSPCSIAGSVSVLLFAMNERFLATQNVIIFIR
jgi:hypothetical protein